MEQVRRPSTDSQAEGCTLDAAGIKQESMVTSVCTMPCTLALTNAWYSLCTGFLASGGRDSVIHVFDVANKYALVNTLEDHSASVTAVKFRCARFGPVLKASSLIKGPGESCWGPPAVGTWSLSFICAPNAVCVRLFRQLLPYLHAPLAVCFKLFRQIHPFLHAPLAACVRLFRQLFPFLHAPLAVCVRLFRQVLPFLHAFPARLQGAHHVSLTRSISCIFGKGPIWYPWQGTWSS